MADQPPMSEDYLGGTVPLPATKRTAPDGNHYTLVGVEIEDVQKLRRELGIVVRRVAEVEELVNDALDQIVRLFKEGEDEPDA